MDKFDLIVLGGGPAGYCAAERAGAAGLKTLVIEKRALGGVCLNEGCIPSKAFLNSAKIYDYAKHDGEKYGVTTTGAKLDHAKVVARKDKVVGMLVAGVGMKMKKNKVTVVAEDAQILGKSADGFQVSAGGSTYVGTQMLLATGSMPVVPPIPGVKEGIEKGFVLTNREILALTELPKSLVVIGGGVIGLEMASYFNSADCKVTVVEMLDSIGGPIDKEISKLLQGVYEKKGVEFRLGCKVTAVNDGEVVYEKDGKSEKVPADKVLLSIGRRAFTAGFGLENLNVYMERGAVVTDECMRTNIAGLYAAGDVNGKSMLAHTAYREAEVAVNNILGKKDRMRYSAIPAVIYTNPEVATVGETEESAKAKGYDVKALTVTMKLSGRYVAENEGGNGICKLVVDQKYNRLLGVHMMGNSSSEIIYGAAMMIETEMKIDDIKEIVFPHPTVSEVIREALFEL